MGHADDTVTQLIHTHPFEQDTTAAVQALEAVAGRRRASPSGVVQAPPRLSGDSTGALSGPLRGPQARTDGDQTAADLRRHR